MANIHASGTIHSWDYQECFPLNKPSKIALLLSSAGFVAKGCIKKALSVSWTHRESPSTASAFIIVTAGSFVQ